jgi:hypothetical protein
MKFALVQRDKQVVLRVMPGMIKVDRDAGDRKALLAAELDVALGTPSIKRAGKDVDVIRLKGQGGCRHGSDLQFGLFPRIMRVVVMAFQQVASGIRSLR